VCCKDDWLGVGGGKGGFALWMDESLDKGTSAESSTFSNSCLCSAESFDIVQVEIWSIGYNRRTQVHERLHIWSSIIFSKQTTLAVWCLCAGAKIDACELRAG
jgi:hypothetical protein